MLLFLLEKTQGLLAHNQVGVWVIAVVVLNTQEVDTYEGQGLVEGFPELFWPCAGERHHQAPFSGRLPLFVNCSPWTSFLIIVLDSKSLFAATALLKVCDITQFLCSLLEVRNKNLHLELVSRYQLKVFQFLCTCTWNLQAGMEVTSAVTIVFTPKLARLPLTKPQVKATNFGLASKYWRSQDALVRNLKELS